MNLENIIIQAELQNNKINVNIFDGNVLELGFLINNLNNIELKNRKKVKLFTKIAMKGELI